MVSKLGHDKKKYVEKKTEVVKRTPSLYDVNSNDNKNHRSKRRATTNSCEDSE